MKTEKHIIKGHFKGQRPHVKVTAYELSTVDCSADKMSGYYSQEATLISDDPEPGYDFAGWSVTGSNVTGNNVRFEGDITAKANYSAHVYNVTLQNDGHGTITADKTTGNLGDTITLSNTPATHYHFSGYSLTGATLTSNQFNIETNDVIAKGWFSEDPKYNLTLQNDGHGSIGAGKTTGYQGDTTTLSNTASTNYKFSAYTVTGATLNGSILTFGAQDATAKAWFRYAPSGSIKVDNTTYNDRGRVFSANVNTGTYLVYKCDISFYAYATTVGGGKNCIFKAIANGTSESNTLYQMKAINEIYYAPIFLDSDTITGASTAVGIRNNLGGWSTRVCTTANGGLSTYYYYKLIFNRSNGICSAFVGKNSNARNYMGCIQQKNLNITSFNVKLTGTSEYYPYIRNQSLTWFGDLSDAVAY